MEVDDNQNQLMGFRYINFSNRLQQNIASIRQSVRTKRSLPVMMAIGSDKLCFQAIFVGHATPNSPDRRGLLDRCWRIPHCHQVVDRPRQNKHPPDSPDPSMASAHQPYRLHPSEDLLHHLTPRLSDPISRMSCPEAMNGRAPIFLGHMRGYLHYSKLLADSIFVRFSVKKSEFFSTC